MPINGEHDARKPVKCVPSQSPDTTDAYLSTDHPDAAKLLGQAGLRAAATLRYGSRRGHLAYGYFPALARSGAVESRLCATVAPPQGRALRRKPKPLAALLPVSGGAETLSVQYPRFVPRFAEGARFRPETERHSLRRGRLGEP